MIRISIPYITELFDVLRQIDALPDNGAPYGEIKYTLMRAKIGIDNLIQRSVFARSIRTSRALANTLVAAIDALKDSKDATVITSYQIWNVKFHYGQYRTALLAELGTLDSYFVTQKGGYDSLSLLERGDVLFPEQVSIKAPEAIIDLKEGCKCLAYECATASAFHFFRAIESVLRRYFSCVTGGAAHPKVRSLGVYIRALEQSKKGDAKIIAVLTQIKDLHRNPLIHPDLNISIDEAINIVGLSRSAISMMLAALPIPAEPAT